MRRKDKWRLAFGLILLLLILFTFAASAMPPKPGAFDFKPNLGWFDKVTGAKVIPPEDVVADKSAVKAATSAGGGKLLVLRIQFSDVAFDSNHDQAYWSDMLFNGSNPGSMKTYYKEISYGQFDVNGVIAPVVTSGKPMSYYGGDGANGTHDLNAGEMIRDAITLTDEIGFDFSQFDLNNDGIIDHLVVLHAGPGQEGGGGQYGANAIWSHRSVVPNSPVVDGVKANGYTTDPDDGQMGVFAHEFGHDLGLPDLYDRDYTSEGLGDWTIMAGGSWNGVPGGSRPSHITAQEKAELGWLQLTNVTGSISKASIPTVSGPNGVPTAYRLWTMGADSKEYFVIENRQKTGYFDVALPGAGLLIYHVDERVGEKQNDDETHYLVALEQADGLNDLEQASNQGDGGDPYPGKTDNRSFAFETKPSSVTYDGLNSFVSVTNISGSKSVMTADLTVIAPPPEGAPTPLSPIGEVDRFRPIFKWSAVEGATGYHLQVSTDTGFANVVYEENGLNGTQMIPETNMDVSKTYYWRIRALSSYGVTDWSPVMSFTTPGVAEILLVIDDGGAFGIEPYYIKALNDVGIYYNAWTMLDAGSPKLSDMSSYKVVIFAGDWGAIQNNFSFQSDLETYLDGGGRLLVTSQDFGWEGSAGYIQKSLFDKMHVSYIQDNSGIFGVSGVAGSLFEGRTLKITGGDGANNQSYPDLLAPVGEAQTVLAYDSAIQLVHPNTLNAKIPDAKKRLMRNPDTVIIAKDDEAGNSAGIYFNGGNFRTLYLGFGIEGISAAADRSDILKTGIELLLSDDTSAPTLTDRSPDTVFSPNNDGVKDIFNAIFELSKQATITAKVYSQEDVQLSADHKKLLVNGSAVKTLLDNTGKPAGTHTLVWDGRDSGGNLVESGAYTIGVEARDSAGNSSIGALEIPVTLEGAISIINNAAATPPVITPNGDGKDDQTEITFDLSEAATQASISLTDSSSQFITHLLQGPLAAGANKTTWNGQINGSVVNDGNYIVQIDAASGDGFDSVRVAVEVEAVNPALSNAAFSPSLFSPNPDSASAPYVDLVSSLTFQLSKKAVVEVKILDKNGNVVRVLQPATEMEAGQCKLQWNGRREDGTFAADGIYTALITAVDRGGNRGEATAQVLIDCTPNEFQNVSVSNWFISPNGDGVKDSTSVKFDVNEDLALAVFRVFDNTAGAWLKNVEYDQYSIPSGTYAVTWDGTMPDGTLADPAHEYYIVLRGYDMAWNRKQIAYRIIIDLDNPVASDLVVNPAQFTPGQAQTSISFRVTDKPVDWANIKLQVKDAAGKVFAILYDEVYDYDFEVVDDFTPVQNSGKQKDPAGFDSIPLPEKQKNQEVSSGSYTMNWDGSGLDGRLLTNGAYMVTLDAVDEAGNKGFTQSAPVEIVGNSGPVSLVTPAIISQSTSVISPNGDGKNDIVTITYELSGQPAIASVLAVVRGDGTQVRTIDLGGNLAPGQYSVTWDGTYDIAMDDAYEWYPYYLILAARDSNNVTSTATAKVFVDLTPPGVTNGLLNPWIFSPNGDGLVDTSSLTFATDQTGYVKVQILDKDMKVIRTVVDDKAIPANAAKKVGIDIPGASEPLYVVVDAGFRKPGSQEVIWDGKKDDGSVTLDGRYWAQLDFEDLGGNEAVSLYGELALDTKPIGSKVVSVSNTAISPNGDGIKDSTAITFSIDEDAVLAYVGVANSKGEIVTKFPFWGEALDKGEYEVTWDGKDDLGKILPDGSYSFFAVLYDQVYNVSEASADIPIDLIKPVFSSLVLDNPTISPNGDKLKDTATLKFTSSEAVYLKAVVFDSEGQQVVVLDNGTKLEGAIQQSNVEVRLDSEHKVRIPVKSASQQNISIEWDGKTSEGKPAPDGVYRLSVECTDMVGNRVDTSSDIKVQLNITDEMGSGGGTLETVDGTRVIVPGGVFKGDTQVSVRELCVEEIPASPVSQTIRPLPNPTARAFTPDNTRFSKGVKVTIPYAEPVAGSNIKEEYLRLFYFDGNRLQWISAGGTPDADLNTVTAEVNHFATYQIMEDTSIGSVPQGKLIGTVICTNNPFSPNGDGVKDVTSIRYVVAKPGKATVRIFDSTGTPVVTLVDGIAVNSGSNTVVWDGTNNVHSSVRSGIYVIQIVFADSSGNKATATKTVGVVTAKAAK